MLKKSLFFIVLSISELSYNLEIGSSLVDAAQHNDLALVKRIIAKMIDIDEVSDNQTALMMACKNLNFEMVKLLVDNKANIHIKDSFGAHALYYIFWSLGDNISVLEDEKKNQNNNM